MRNPHGDTSGPLRPVAGREPPLPAGGTPPLLALLARGAKVSGPELARRLGISRAAVSARIARWRSTGLEIETCPGGYRLRRPLQPVDPARVRDRLPAAVRRRVGLLESHWQLDSTSSELARRAARLPDLAFVCAEWQRAGRGRRGRGWLSPPATNIQLSCLKRYALGFRALSGLSLVAGIAAVRALADGGVRGIGLKWPNDLVHADAKLGGILVELGGDATGPCHAIVGVGINVYVPDAVRATLARPCADLARLCDGGTAPSREALTAALVTRLVEALDEFARNGFAGFAGDWARYDALAGRRIFVEGAQGSFDGVAAGVDRDGALRVRCDDELHRVDSAEVTVRPA